LVSPLSIFRTTEVIMVAKKTEKNWIAGAIKRPGAFTKKAKKAGKSVAGMAAAVTKNPSKYSKLTVQQANLAKTLRKINKGK
jgi:hypothetical protein